mmetsp:Transcript_117538/g.379319  ORF Transcript_117538/g.379319 Transcript_117538/m.379319 type:complete len:305 (-) Transcript_117538:456-1370(-)
MAIPVRRHRLRQVPTDADRLRRLVHAGTPAVVGAPAVQAVRAAGQDVRPVGREGRRRGARHGPGALEREQRPHHAQRRGADPPVLGLAQHGAPVGRHAHAHDALAGVPRHGLGEAVAGPRVPGRQAAVLVAHDDDARARVRPAGCDGSAGRDGPERLPSLQVPELHRSVGARGEGVGATAEEAASAEGSEMPTERMQQPLGTEVQQPQGVVGRRCQQHAGARREVHGDEAREVPGDREMRVQPRRLAVEELDVPVGRADGHERARQRRALHAGSGHAGELGPVDLAEDALPRGHRGRLDTDTAA